MYVLALICSAILIMEFVLHGLAMFIGMEAGIAPIVTHLGFRPHRAFLLLLGVVDVAVAAGLIAGFWRPSLGMAAAGYAVVLFGTLLVIRLVKDLGTLINPPNTPIFLLAGVLLLITYVLR